MGAAGMSILRLTFLGTSAALSLTGAPKYALSVRQQLVRDARDQMPHRVRSSVSIKVTRDCIIRIEAAPKMI